jgi:hypothetical protein
MPAQKIDITQRITRARAEDKQKDASSREYPLQKRFIGEWGLLSGFGNSGDLAEKDNYKVVPLILRIGFDVKSLLQNKLHFSPPGITEFELEPFLNPVIGPDRNIEAGCGFLLKYAYPLSRRFYPYIEAGAGIIYITQHTREQATQYNFIPQAGGGLIYFLEENLALTLGYRYRHLSNASIKQPNRGIELRLYLLGLSLFY